MAVSPREKLFAVLTERLAYVSPDSGSLVECPLCLRPFGRQALDSAELTAEHIIPRKLGGRNLTLTCRSCNNVHGTRLDSHLIQMVRTRDTLKGHGRIQVEIPTSAGTAVANLAWRSGAKGDPKTFRIVGKATKPAAAQALQSSLRAGRDLTFTMLFNFKRGPAYQALYRIAYLSLFDDVGYTYVHSPGGAFVRAALDAKGYESGIPVLEATASAELPNPVLIVPISSTVSAVIVIIRLKAGSIRHYAVVFPPPESQLSIAGLKDLALSLSKYRLQAIGSGGYDLSIRFAPEAFSAWAGE